MNNHLTHAPNTPNAQAKECNAKQPDMLNIRPADLGSKAFCEDYGIKYAYLSGAMYKGIASKELVIAMGKAGLMGFLGAGGMKPAQLRDDIHAIQASLNHNQAFGVNVLANTENPAVEMQTVDLLLQQGVQNIEAAAFTQITPAIVKFRLSGFSGFRRSDKANTAAKNSHTRIIAKLSRPEIAELFMSPPPANIVASLLDSGQITPEQASIAPHIPVAQDICVESDSGGHTDAGIATVLLPSIMALRTRLMQQFDYSQPIRIGAAGGIGTPESVLAMQMLGADFFVTGSINQCTVEAGTSDAAKDILQSIDVQDTAYAPAGDMFEIGAQVQVVRKGLLFANRGNKLYELYQRCNSLDDIEPKLQKQIQDKYFKCSFDEVWQETAEYLQRTRPQALSAIANHPKKKLAAVLKWYFVHSTRLALSGSDMQRADYQIHCGPALGAFNQWVKGTPLEHWRNRHVAHIADTLMHGAADLLAQQLARFVGSEVSSNCASTQTQPSGSDHE